MLAFCVPVNDESTTTGGSTKSEENEQDTSTYIESKHWKYLTTWYVVHVVSHILVFLFTDKVTPYMYTAFSSLVLLVIIWNELGKYWPLFFENINDNDF